MRHDKQAGLNGPEDQGLDFLHIIFFIISL